MTVDNTIYICGFVIISLYMTMRELLTDSKNGLYDSLHLISYYLIHLEDEYAT